MAPKFTEKGNEYTTASFFETGLFFPKCQFSIHFLSLKWNLCQNKPIGHIFV